MYEKIVDLIRVSKDFVLTSHVNPDGDSIGSEIAFYKYLEKTGKNAKIINYSETPYNYTFLDTNGIIEKFDENRHGKLIENADVVLILDTNEYSRLRTMEPFVKSSKAKKVCIDHHAGINGSSFDMYISDTSSPATAEILYKFFEKINADDLIDKQMAVALYTAIMTDTGSFRFPRTSAESHRIASRLIEKGVDPFEVYSEVYNQSAPGRLKLLARFLNNLETAFSGKLVYSYLKNNDFIETGTNEMDTDGFSGNLMSVAGVKVCIVILETPKGIKLSFRSNDNIKVNELAKEFAGGGHINAAGAFVPDGNFENIKNEVISKAEKFLPD
jgi:phosphoesterase RecJ-like protein